MAAPTPARCSHDVTLDTSGGPIYDGTVSDGNGCMSFAIVNQDTANTLLVNIPVLHGSGYFPVLPGGTQVFRHGTLGIKVVNAKAGANTTLMGWGEVATI